MATPGPAEWLTLLVAIMVIARELLPELWLRYRQIAGELERMPPDDAAARARLAKSRSVKIWEGADFDAFGAALWPGYRGPYTTPELTRATELAGEALRLEKQFEAALVQKLGAELWESEAVDDRRPLTAGRVHPTNWTGPIDKIVFHYDVNAIEIEPGNWLRRVRLRPTPIERSDPSTAKEPADPGANFGLDAAAAPDKAEDTDPELQPASDAQIDQAIKRAYDEAQKNQAKPPNVNEIAEVVQELLKRDGRKASGRRIKKLSEAEKHAIRRLPGGPRFSKSS
jgi:hypothetical protein